MTFQRKIIIKKLKKDGGGENIGSMNIFQDLPFDANEKVEDKSILILWIDERSDDDELLSSIFLGINCCDYLDY